MLACHFNSPTPNPLPPSNNNNNNNFLESVTDPIVFEALASVRGDVANEGVQFADFASSVQRDVLEPLVRLREGGETVARAALNARAGEREVKVALDRAARAATRYAAAHSKASATCTAAGVAPSPLWSPPAAFSTSSNTPHVTPTRLPQQLRATAAIDTSTTSELSAAVVVNDAELLSSGPMKLIDDVNDDGDVSSDAGDIGILTNQERQAMPSPDFDATQTGGINPFDDFSLSPEANGSALISTFTTTNTLAISSKPGLPPHMPFRRSVGEGAATVAVITDTRDIGLTPIAAVTAAGASVRRAASVGSASDGGGGGGGGGGSFASVGEAAAAGATAVSSTLKRIFFRSSNGAGGGSAIPPGSASQTTAERIEALRSAAAAAMALADEALVEAQEAWAAFLRARERLSSAFAATVVIAADLERKRVAELSDALRRYTVFAASRAANIQYDVQRLSTKAEAVAGAPALTRAAVMALRAAEAAVEARAVSAADGGGPRMNDLFAAAGVGAVIASGSSAAQTMQQSTIATTFDGGGGGGIPSRHSSITGGSGGEPPTLTHIPMPTQPAQAQAQAQTQRVVVDGGGAVSVVSPGGGGSVTGSSIASPGGVGIEGSGPAGGAKNTRRMFGMFSGAFSRGKKGGGTPPPDLFMPPFESSGGGSVDGMPISPSEGPLNASATTTTTSSSFRRAAGRDGSFVVSIASSLALSPKTAALRDLIRPRSGTSRSTEELAVRGPSPGLGTTNGGVSVSVSVTGTATGDRHAMGVRETSALLHHLHISDGPLELIAAALFDPLAVSVHVNVDGIVEYVPPVPILTLAPLLSARTLATTLAAFTGTEGDEAPSSVASPIALDVPLDTDATVPLSTLPTNVNNVNVTTDLPLTTTPAVRRASWAALPSSEVNPAVPALLPAALLAIKESPDGVSRLVMALDARRAEGCTKLTTPSFDAVTQLLLAALDVIEARADFARAAALMAISQSFFCVSPTLVAAVRPPRLYLQTRVRSHALWQNQGYWEAAVYDAIGTEVSKFSAGRSAAKVKGDKSVALESRARDADVVYAQLGFFAFTMISFRHPEER